MHLAVELVGPGGVGEQPVDGGGDLGRGLPRRGAGGLTDALGKLTGARLQVLGDIVEDLRAQVPGAVAPGLCLVRGFDRVANVLAVAFADFADLPAGRVADRAAVA